jgi:hypothetical protein
MRSPAIFLGGVLALAGASSALVTKLPWSRVAWRKHDQRTASDHQREKTSGCSSTGNFRLSGHSPAIDKGTMSNSQAYTAYMIENVTAQINERMRLARIVLKLRCVRTPAATNVQSKSATEFVRAM